MHSKFSPHTALSEGHIWICTFWGYLKRPVFDQQTQVIADHIYTDIQCCAVWMFHTCFLCCSFSFFIPLQLFKWPGYFRSLWLKAWLHKGTLWEQCSSVHRGLKQACNHSNHSNHSPAVQLHGLRQSKRSMPSNTAVSTNNIRMKK